MNRRSMLGSLAAALLAPFAIKAKAAPAPLTPCMAEIRDGDWIRCHYAFGSPKSDSHLMAVAASCNKVNASVFEVALVGHDRPVCFPPETLMLSRIVRHSSPGDSLSSYAVDFTYKASGYNHSPHPDGGLRRVVPAPYATSDFEPFVDAAGRGVVFERVSKVAPEKK